LPAPLRKDPAWRAWHHKLYVGPLQAVADGAERLVDIDANGYRFDARVRFNRDGTVQPVGAPPQYLDRNGFVNPGEVATSFAKAITDGLAGLSGTVGQPGGLPPWPDPRVGWVELPITFYHLWPGGGAHEGDGPVFTNQAAHRTPHRPHRRPH
jgi:hypothetical protein